MKKVILDSSFILTCVRQKIDFFEEIYFLGIKILIPKEVINEIIKVSDSKKKLKFKEDAKLALKLIEKNKNNFEEIKINSSYVDKGIINFAKKNKRIIIATLDKKLKEELENPKMFIRGKKKIEIL